MSLVVPLRTCVVSSLITITVMLIPAMTSAQDFVTPSLAQARIELDPVLDPVPAVAGTTPRLAPAAASGRRGVLVPLYLSFAALQALDTHSTLRAIRGGAVEQNPMLHSIAHNPTALSALKLGVAASTIVLADKLRNRSRVGAIVLMAGLNSFYAAVVAHNYAVTR